MPDADDFDLDDLVCRLCWVVFDSPGELAAHEQEETERFYKLGDDEC